MKNQNIKPPILAEKLFEWYCDNAAVEDLHGDMEELFYSNLARMSANKAKFKYWQQVLSLVFSYAIKKRKQKSAYHPCSSHSINLTMIRNYLKIAFRNLIGHKVLALINVLGLVIGMTAFILIAQYIYHELSYDNFWRNESNVFRVNEDLYDKGELSTRWAAGCSGIGPDLKANFPEVKSYVRMASESALLSYGDIFFKEEYVYYASEDFFKVFGYPLIEGEDSKVLKGLDKIVLSHSLAKKYFGNENPIGKTMRNNGKDEYIVSGIFEDLPENSHMKVNALFSFATFAKIVGRKSEADINDWLWNGFLTYVLLDKKADAKKFEAKLPAFVTKYQNELLKKHNLGMVFHLMSVGDIHLDSDFIGEVKPNGSRDTVYFLSVVATLIILIAWINYINLSTAKSVERAREVGVRKVMGGFRNQLIQQFLTESLLLNMIAVLVAIAASLLLLPWFGQLTERPLDYSLFKQKLFWLFAVALVAGGTLLSGLYPAFVLSAFRPVEVLKGRFKNSGKGVFFRKGMVVTQFITSITLIVGTYTVYTQINFMRSQKLGVSIDQTVVLPSPNIVDSTNSNKYEGFNSRKYEVFKQRLSQSADVLAVSASTSIPGGPPNWNAMGIRRISQREDEQKQYRVIMMDHNFVSSYGLEVVTGRAFGNNPNENKTVLLNEAAVKLMGFEKPEDALDDQIFFWGDTFRIVGVLKNYRQESLKKNFEPMIFRYDKSPEGFYSIKLNTANVKESLAKIETHWKELFPGNPFDYFFLDEHYNKQYKADQQFGRVFGIFSGLAIFIACLGLFGLSSLTAIHRTKEIGVRKVFGASVTNILILVSRDYIMLMGIAIALATPLTWWMMNNWLSGFANHITMVWWIFALPSLLVIVIALLTVSIHTLKAATANPVDSLRYE